MASYCWLNLQAYEVGRRLKVQHGSGTVNPWQQYRVTRRAAKAKEKLDKDYAKKVAFENYKNSELFA